MSKEVKESKTENKVQENHVPDHGICKEPNCNEKATIDYNGHGYWVCRYHYDKLSDYFDEEYR